MITYREVVDFADFDFASETLNRLDVVKSQLRHLLGGLEDLFDAWRKVAEFTSLFKDFVGVFDCHLGVREVKKHRIN